MVRRFGRFALVAVAVLLLGGVGPVAARTDPPRATTKVVVIVGPAGAATAAYRRIADETVAAASKLTSNVVRVYSPDATWERVKAALQGASVVVYLGHGNGWPSIYRDALYPPTQNGFGLNPHAGAADSHQYFGEDRIAAEIKLAPNAVVVFSHLCYASGNTEPGLAEGTLTQAQQRVDNYAAGFLKAGAGAVIADAYLSPRYYVTSVLAGRRTVDAIWRTAPNRNDHFLTFRSVRTKGAVAVMDPDQVASGFHRSIVLTPRLTSAQVLGGSMRRPIEVEPVQEPSLIGLGVTFGTPDLATPPTAGTATRLVLPIARDTAALLPDRLLVGTRWDRLDAATPGAAPTAPGAPAAAPGAPAATPTPSPSPSPSPSPAQPMPGSGSSPAGSPLPDLVVPEVPGEVVAPVVAKRLATGGLSVAVRVPSAPGLYRLVATIHREDGLAFDAATQALVPALVVRVTGPRTAAYAVQPAAIVRAGANLGLSVAVSNLGKSPWGHPAIAWEGVAEREPASQATVVARWVSLGASGGGQTATMILPAGMAPGATALIDVQLAAPSVPGEYLAGHRRRRPGRRARSRHWECHRASFESPSRIEAPAPARSAPCAGRGYASGR